MATVYARVVSATVQETFSVPAGFSIAECFNPGVPGSWVECDQTLGVAFDWTYDGSTFTPPTTPS